MRKTLTILGANIDHITRAEALAIIERFIQTGSAHHIITANAEIVYQAKNDPARRQIINQADLVTADGAGVILASKILGQPLPERVAGIDLFHDICNAAQSKGWRIYIIGAKEEVITKAVANLRAQYPACTIAGYHNGYFTAQDEPQILAQIQAARPDIILVAMGMPKQDDWILAHQKQLQIPVAMGVGGCLDVISGNLKRAPQWMQKCGLEWLYRLILQPSRLGRMMALPKFVVAVLGEKMRGRK